MIISIFIFLLVSQSVFAQISPDYCYENPGCSESNVDSTESKKMSLFGESLFRRDFQQRMEEYALESLLKQKSNILTLYPHISGKVHSSVTDEIVKKSVTRGFLAETKVSYSNNTAIKKCIDKKPRLNDKIKESNRSIATEEQRKAFLANLLIGAIASEKSIEKLPALEAKVSKLEGKLEKNNKKLKLVEYQKRRPGRCYQIGCYKEKERRAELKHKRLLDERELLTKEYKLSTDALSSLEKAALSNSLFVESSEFYESGRFKKSSFVDNSLKQIRNIKSKHFSGDDFIDDLRDGLISSESGMAVGQARLIKLFDLKPKLLESVDSAAKKQMSKQLSKLNEGVKELCSSDANHLLHHGPFINKFKDVFKRDTEYDSVDDHFDKTHCSLLKKHAQKSLDNAYLTAAGVTAAGVILGAATFGVGAAVVALGAGSIALGGVGAVDLYQHDTKYDISSALSEVSLESLSHTRDLLSEFRNKSTFVGLDAVLMPISLGALKPSVLKGFSKIRKAKGTERVDTAKPVSKPKNSKTARVQKSESSSTRTPSSYSLDEVNIYFKIDKLDKGISLMRGRIQNLPQGQRAGKVRQLKQMLTKRKNMTKKLGSNYSEKRYTKYRTEYIEEKGEALIVRHVDSSEYEGSLLYQKQQMEKLKQKPNVILSTTDNTSDLSRKSVTSINQSHRSTAPQELRPHESIYEQFDGVKVIHHRGKDRTEAIKEYKALVKKQEEQKKLLERRRLMKEQREDNIRRQGSSNTTSQNLYMEKNAADLKLVEYTPTREASPFFTNSDGNIITSQGEIFLYKGKPIRHDQLKIDAKNFKELFNENIIKP